MAVRETLQIGDPKLKAKNKIVTNLKNKKVLQVIKDLHDTMIDNDLIGMAAPQIGENYKIIITQPRKTKARKLAKGDKLRVYINPVITNYSKTENIIYEGCGSISHGNIFAPVKRPKEITIEATNEIGMKFTLTCDGILARVIQHEYDHLSGIEFTEKIMDVKLILDRVFYLKKIRNSRAQISAGKITKVDYREL
jgi:peptide deformylase